MTTRLKIIQLVRAAPGITNAELTKELGLTKQAVNYQLRQLLARGLVERDLFQKASPAGDQVATFYRYRLTTTARPQPPDA